MSYKKSVRYFFNTVVILSWTIIFYLQFERPFIARTIQNISPALLVSTLPHNLLWISWISLPLFLFVVFKGRSFCWNMCPVGLLQDTLPSLGKTKFTKMNLYVFLGVFTASLFGINILAIFDPLVTFNRAVISLELRLIEFIIFFGLIAVIVSLSVYKRRLWCFKLCPLGAFLDLLRLPKFDIDRRRTLVAISSGLVFGSLLKTKNIWAGSTHDRLLRPPGALPEDKFTERCIRCGSCIAVCLTKTLTPVILESGIEGIFTPKLVPQVAECDELCNKCGGCCPTQAIQSLPLSVKKRFKIGTAKIDCSICISCRNEGLCLVCQEHCPYLAIKIVKNQFGNPCPEMIPELCRGCGFCEKVCPTRPVRAIKIYNTGAGQIIDA